jgi:hypothetical protein
MAKFDKKAPQEKAPQEKADEKTVHVAPTDPVAPTYKMGYNHEKMRQSCGKCGGTQLLITNTFFKPGPGGADGKPTKVKDGFEFTCNDCKQVYSGK